jgi:hypothetical protein
MVVIGIVVPSGRRIKHLPPLQLPERPPYHLRPAARRMTERYLKFVAVEGRSDASHQAHSHRLFASRTAV